MWQRSVHKSHYWKSRFCGWSLNYELLSYVQWRRCVTKPLLISLLPFFSYTILAFEVSNIGLTFGGYWHEKDRANVDNWNNSDGTVPFSQEPKRVPKVGTKFVFLRPTIYYSWQPTQHTIQTMYESVSQKGSCVAPYLTVSTQTCSRDSDCHDGNR